MKERRKTVNTSSGDELISLAVASGPVAVPCYTRRTMKRNLTKTGFAGSVRSRIVAPTAR
jgi:hypothetical protein